MPVSRLIDVHDSVLIVIDVQASFLKKLPAAEGALLVQRIRWLIGVAQWANVPLIVTAEDMSREPLDPQIGVVLPPETCVYDKLVFGLAGQPDILAAVEQTQRRTAILVGLETDVCIAQSALGLLDCGYRVAVIADATGSPGTAHSFGLERIRQAGGLVLSIKGLYYEWIGSIPQLRAFDADCAALGMPAEIVM